MIYPETMTTQLSLDSQSSLPDPVPTDIFNRDDEDVLGSVIIDELLEMHQEFNQGGSDALAVNVCEDPMDPWRGVWDNTIPSSGFDFNFDTEGTQGGALSNNIS